ncbi:carboxymuconolactone decarboxylase family protein [Octadecabacter sp. 1_MG-2023]|uniref:carboxymuconolactone decarboxylase family protein n=1 Tax=unclassified Octadecabacter TaxID=196158 RepID=UPI001C0A13DD|nr:MULTISPECIES: carboxymuconolactone decarboxylase family protein [unclassified Octadecabacter]MBU2993804.1 carboxymuconolactone decarboxylase family protein [Octadecabacter sp. B2R22]MDO6735351.1 carboxymuconolactone decarboxylase family protein [Octadecabacter sp. 1_MG-2023]
MSDQNPFEAWIKTSQDWAKGVSPEFAEVMAESMKGVQDLMPTMPKEMMEAFIGKGANPDALDAKTKLLLTLQGLTIQGAIAEPQITLTVRHALEAGATPTEVTETIGLAGLFGGALGMTKALELANAVINKAPTDKDAK